MSHPRGHTDGRWDANDYLRCPVRPYPSFGTRPKIGGHWYDRGNGMYDIECLLRAGGTGATSGSGAWILRLPSVDGYRLYVNPPHFTNGEKQNSYWVADAVIGKSTGSHILGVSVHTLSSNPAKATDEMQLVFTKPGSMFIAGGGWTPGNVHIRSARPFPGRWVRES